MAQICYHRKAQLFRTYSILQKQMNYYKWQAPWLHPYAATPSIHVLTPHHAASKCISTNITTMHPDGSDLQPPPNWLQDALITPNRVLLWLAYPARPRDVNTATYSTTTLILAVEHVLYLKHAYGWLHITVPLCAALILVVHLVGSTTKHYLLHQHDCWFCTGVVDSVAWSIVVALYRLPTVRKSNAPSKWESSFV